MVVALWPQVVIGCSTDELSGCDITLTGLSASDMASLIDSSSPAVSPSLRSSLLTYGLGLPALVPLACVLPPDAAAAALTSPEAAHNPCTALATAAGSSLPDETRQILHALCAFPSTFTVASASRIAGPKAVPALSRLSSLSLLRTHTDGSLSVSPSFSRPHVPEPALISFVTATTAVMNAAEAALAEGNAVLAMHLYDIHHDDVNYILWLASVAHEQPLGK